MVGNHQSSIYKWLFGVAGIYKHMFQIPGKIIWGTFNDTPKPICGMEGFHCFSRFFPAHFYWSPRSRTKKYSREEEHSLLKKFNPQHGLFEASFFFSFFFPPQKKVAVRTGVVLAWCKCFTHFEGRKLDTIFFLGGKILPLKKSSAWSLGPGVMTHDPWWKKGIDEEFLIQDFWDVKMIFVLNGLRYLMFALNKKTPRMTTFFRRQKRDVDFSSWNWCTFRIGIQGGFSWTRHRMKKLSLFFHVFHVSRF